MPDLLFYVFSSLTLIAALLTVVVPGAVTGAMCMIVAFVGTAALFVLLEAYFLAILQVMVYAGAVMVLFLFIIMLLNVEEGEGSIGKRKSTWFVSSVGFACLLVPIVFTFWGGGHLLDPVPPVVTAHPEVASADGFPFTTSAKSFGYSLFSKYMLPFQVCGFLLLAGMVGVIVISKKPSCQLKVGVPAAEEGDAL